MIPKALYAFAHKAMPVFGWLMTAIITCLTGRFVYSIVLDKTNSPLWAWLAAISASVALILLGLANEQAEAEQEKAQTNRRFRKASPAAAQVDPQALFHQPSASGGHIQPPPPQL